MKVFCEQELCIYWQDHSCILDELEIDSLGGCANCIRVNIGEEYLREKRIEALLRLEQSMAEG